MKKLVPNRQIDDSVLLFSDCNSIGYKYLAKKWEFGAKTGQF